MKPSRWLAITGVLAGLAATAVAMQATGPKIKLSATTWDFGTIKHPDKAEYTLIVSNEGSAELRLTEVKSNCGCTVAQPNKYVLAPGESTEVKVTFDTKGKQDEVRSHVTITSNDPVTPEMTFQLKAFVRRIVRQDPQHGLMFKVIEPSDVVTRSVKLINQVTEPMRPAVRALTSDRFGVELRELKPGQEYEVIVTTRPPLSRGAAAETVEITTGLAEEPTVSISLQVSMVDRVNFSPPVLFIKPPLPPAHKAQMRIEYYGKDPNFQITGTTCEDPTIKLRLDPPQPSQPMAPGVLPPTRFYPLQLEFLTGAKIPPQGLTVRVTTNDPQYPELQFVITSDVSMFQELLRRAQVTSQRRMP